MDSTVSLKVKITEEEIIGARSLACGTLGVKGRLKLWNGTRKIDKHINYSHGPAQTKQRIG
jgi:hypothetical protein